MIAGPIINLLVDALPGIDQDYLDLVETTIQGKPAATVAKFIGEFGVLAPQIFATGGLGRMAAGALMRKSALEAGKRGAAEAVMVTTTTGKLKAKALDIGGVVAKALPKLKGERAAVIVGANLAFGWFFGVLAAV